MVEMTCKGLKNLIFNFFGDSMLDITQDNLRVNQFFRTEYSFVEEIDVGGFKGYKTKDGEIVVVIDKVLETIAQAFINDLISLGEALYFLYQTKINFYLICIGCELDFELIETVLPINIKLACFR